jgi:dTDP-4-dehydrorhamnose reductase
VLVAGAGGRLGAEIVHAFRDWHVIAHTRASLDVTDGAAVRRAAGDASPALIVNCSAYNDVDGAESAAADAFAVNALAVRAMARAAEECNATFVHYSTDFVFDGRASEPYLEDAETAPQSVYGLSKLLGEWMALDAPRAYVLRVESLFGSAPGWTGRRSTIDGLVEGLQQGREVKAFTDRVVSPSYTPDIAAATRHLVETGAPSGVYHCVNAGQGTWYEVATEAARLLGVPPNLRGITVRELPLKASRPRYCALANGKLAAAGFPMPSWQDALARWVANRMKSSHG